MNKLLINREDFDCIGQVVKHCDYKKLCQAIGEAQDFDLRELFCGFWGSIEENWEDESEPWNSLINGGKFTDCRGNTQSFKGVKAILAYYAYSRYVYINEFNDTAIGNKKKNTEFSLPQDYRVIKDRSNKFRDMGRKEFERVEAFVCLVKRDRGGVFWNVDNEKETVSDFKGFDNADFCNCKPCGCNGICGSKTVVKGFGLRGRVIRKFGG